MKFNVKTLYVYKFISQCLPIYAFYTILFIERGKSVSDIALLIALWSLFTIIFEIPSGVLADRWNRRNMLAWSAVFQGLCFIIWFFSHTFFMFALGFIFWGISGAFASGTEEGLIYDNLKSDGNEEKFTQIYGKARFYATIGTVFGIGSAGVIATFVAIENIALISAAICFLNVIFALQIREKNLYSEGIDRNVSKFFDTFKEAGIFLKETKVAIVFIVFLALFANIGGFLDEFDALIINDFGLSHIWVSVILTVRFVFVAFGELVAPIVQRRVSSVKTVFLFSMLACTFLTIFSVIWDWYAILFFGFSFMIMAINEILLVNALQNKIKEEGRATVMSFYGIALDMVMICFGLVYGLLAGLLPLQYVYLVISIYGFVGGAIFYIGHKLRTI
ncbi:MAG: MFS transporter [Defluviitaleaceae bacterium]|nr:MFS transporter [Defluviitaleaceae bacterium]